LWPVNRTNRWFQIRQSAVQIDEASRAGQEKLAFCGCVAGGERNTGFMTLTSSAHRNDLDIWSYVNDILRRLLDGEPNYEPMLPWNWATEHPKSIRKFRQEERRQSDLRKTTNRDKRRVIRMLLEKLAK